tara:strand:+ start:461 stop:1000 length:540 start_codon:yes stop_codon:yes gene_type:complete
MPNFINIYTKDQSEIIISKTEGSINLMKLVSNLGEVNNNQGGYKNKYFLEVSVFDENESFLFKLNTGRPLLQKENGEFYLGDYHIHNEVYMEGNSHTLQPHPSLVKVKENQIDVFPIRQTYSSTDNIETSYCIKPSQIFDVIKGLPDAVLNPKTKFKIQYAIFQDIMLTLGEKLGVAYG